MNLPISVLLIDDDELVSTCISTWLEDEGFTTHVAGNADEALRIMETVPIDLALVDLQLGETSGEDLIVAAFARHPGTCFMIHTGKHFYLLPARLLELGMLPQDVILKPILNLDAFAAAIRQRVTGVAPNDVK